MLHLSGEGNEARSWGAPHSRILNDPGELYNHARRQLCGYIGIVEFGPFRGLEEQKPRRYYSRMNMSANTERCPWCGDDPLYVRYHDEEWGVPVYTDALQFEFLVLESAQAGLSWLTILKKRENYRRAFAGFDPQRVAEFGEPEIRALLEDAGIVRNRKKIEAAVNNASRFLEVQREFASFCEYIWGFQGGAQIVNRPERLEQVPAFTELSRRIAEDMKARGFRFLGPTILYAHMQATGMVNDHLTTCFRHAEVQRARR